MSKEKEATNEKDVWIKQAKAALQELRNTDSTNNNPNRIRGIASNALFGEFEITSR